MTNLAATASYDSYYKSSNPGTYHQILNHCCHLYKADSNVKNLQVYSDSSFF